MANGVTGMANLLKSFHDLATLAERNKTVAIKMVGQEYANDVKKVAPYKTGTYRRSIHVEPVNSECVIVGTDLPYGKRLEYGFNDRDKLGRVYHQAPRPHFRPTMDANFPKYQRMYVEALGRVY